MFCEPTRHETEEAEPKGSHFHPWEYFEKAGEWIIEIKEEGLKEFNELGSPPKCYGNEIKGGGQCSSAPPGDGGDNPFGPYPIPPE